MRYHEIQQKKLVEANTVPDKNEDQASMMDISNDVVHKASLSDITKPKLTLKMVNRLKKIRAAKDYEMAKRYDLLTVMYGPDESDEL